MVLHFLLSLLLSPIFAISAETSSTFDPCNPSPCGPNTLCGLTQDLVSLTISCECLPGHTTSELGKGCQPDFGIEGKNIDSDSTTLSKALTTTTSPSASYASTSLASITSTAYPASWIPSSWSASTVASLGNIVRESSSNPNLAMDFQEDQNQAPVSNTNIDYVFVDTADLFPEECLVHEDCAENEFCSPPPDNRCLNACSIQVCGSLAVCSASLHRPVCSCPHGFHGDPYDRCTKVPSRVGLKFRRK